MRWNSNEVFENVHHSAVGETCWFRLRQLRQRCNLHVSFSSFPMRACYVRKVKTAPKKKGERKKQVIFRPWNRIKEDEMITQEYVEGELWLLADFFSFNDETGRKKGEKKMILFSCNKTTLSGFHFEYWG